MLISKKKEDPRVIVPLTSLVKDGIKQIKYRKGFTNTDVCKSHKTERIYAKVMFRLLELMIMDVLDGNIVYFSKRTGARFYVDYRDVTIKNVLNAGKFGRPDIEKVDFGVTNMRTPFVAFDPGYKGSGPCLVTVPKYLYNDLIHRVNGGKKYAKASKDFWFNKPPTDKAIKYRKGRKEFVKNLKLHKNEG